LPEEQVIKPHSPKINTIILFGAQAAASFLSFVAIFCLTRYLGPEKFGLYATALAFVALFLPIADLGIDLALTRLVAKDRSRLKILLGSTLKLKVVLSALTVIVIYLVALILKYDLHERGLILIAALGMFFLSITNSFIASIRALQRMEMEAVSLIVAKLSFVILVLIMIFLGAGLTEMLICQLLGNMIFCVVAFVLLTRKVGPLEFPSAFEFGLIREGLPFCLSALFVAVYFKIDTVMLSRMVGEGAVGYYNAAYNLVFALMLISNSMVAVAFPAMASHYKNDFPAACNVFKQGFRYSLVLGLPFACGGTYLASGVISLIYGQNYLPSVVALKIIIWTVPIIFLTNLFGNSLGAIGLQKKVAAVAGVNAVVNILLNFWLIPIYSFSGSAVATVVTELLGLAIMTPMVLKIFKPEWASVTLLTVVSNVVAVALLYILKVENLSCGVAIYFIVYILLLLMFRVVEFSDLAFWRRLGEVREV
jgi:O-antigen/teichoic acid export membrane protein